jgi:hypothetical protein
METSVLSAPPEPSPNSQELSPPHENEMRKWVESASIALGITTLYLLWLVHPIATPGNDAVYHWSSSASQLYLPVALDFCLVWLLLTPLFLFARRPGRLRVAVWAVTIFSIPRIALANWAYLSAAQPSRSLSIALLAVALVGPFLIIVFWRPAFKAKFETSIALVSTLLIFISLSGIAILGELAWCGWQARSLNTQMPLHRAVANRSANAGRPRIIWIVFDELSYDQLYERRFQGLQLPAFDQLAAQATVFTHVIPAGIRTEQVLPSLMTGDRVDGISVSDDWQHLSIHNPDTKTWQQFDDHDTVFQDALNAGYSTAVAGWYNPYCRIMPAVLDHCFWALEALGPNGLVPNATTEANMLAPLRYLAESQSVHRFLPLVTRIPAFSGSRSEPHISDYLNLLDAADKVLDDRSEDFALLHLPIPHPGGIYNRATGQFALRHSTYIDNLALADKCLAHLRAKLEQTHEWDSSTIVIIGDHSWRTTLLWRSATDWTQEDEAASQGGTFDDRPAYIVKLPQQTVGTRIEAPFAAVNTRKLLDALLTRNIRSADDLSTWTSKDISVKGN